MLNALGFSYFDSKSCMRVVTETPLDQPDSSSFCKSLNVRASLAKPTSQDEERRINQLLEEAGGNERYLAIVRDAATGSWVWDHDGTELVVKRESIRQDSLIFLLARMEGCWL